MERERAECDKFPEGRLGKLLKTTMAQWLQIKPRELPSTCRGGRNLQDKHGTDKLIT